MKILFLSAANSIHTVRWINSLTERGHEIYLIYNEGHNPKENVINNKVHLHPLKYSGGKGYYLNAKELKKLEEQIKPDVINVHYASGYGTLARRSNIGPYLLSVWGSDVYEFPYLSKVNKYILKKNVKHAKMLASTSECMAEHLRKVLDDPYLQIGITPFGVDMDCFKVSDSNDNNNQIIIGNVKTLEAVYRICDLIDAFKLLKENLQKKGMRELADKIKVLIYGDGNLKDELSRQIKELSLENCVYLKGKIPNTEVPKALQQFDIFCATSEKESFGVAVVEAMAMEKPVVATDAEGFREIIIDGETGFIVEKKNISQMAERLEQLVLDKKMRQTFGKAARKRVEELYDWEKNVDTMETLYKQLKGEYDEYKTVYSSHSK